MTIREQLFAMQDLGYRDFHAGLMPTVDKARIIGVRVPQLRALAKRLCGTAEAEEFLCQLDHIYYEEWNLHAFLVEQERDFTTAVAEVERLLPHIDNWATCDMLSPKVFRGQKSELLPHIEAWLNSDKTYTVRFGVKMLMEHFLDTDFDAHYLARVAAVQSEEYYVNMMLAWYFATALAKQYDAALPYLRERRLGQWVHNKTIQKAVESYRITPEQKAYLRTLRRREKEEK